MPLFGLSVPFPTGKSERRLEIEQYSGEALFSDASQDSNRSLGRFRFSGSYLGTHHLDPQQLQWRCFNSDPFGTYAAKGMYPKPLPSRQNAESDKTGMHSPWVSPLLREFGREEVVAHARNVRLIETVERRGLLNNREVTVKVMVTS